MITPENLKKICSLLGIEGGEKERKVARVSCFGGINVKKRSKYNSQSCNNNNWNPHCSSPFYRYYFTRLN